MPKMPKQAEAKRDGVINPQNYNFKYPYEEKRIGSRLALRINHSKEENTPVYFISGEKATGVEMKHCYFVFKLIVFL